MPVKRRTSDPFAERAPLWPLQKPTPFKIPVAGQLSALPRARTVPSPAIERRRLVQRFAESVAAERFAAPMAEMGMRVKRVMDVFVSSLVLLFLWPLVAVIALAVKLESHGPVIYRSRRVGKYGREFDCYKFRTMFAGSDALKESLGRLNQRCGPFFKIADDPRITRFGSFLRKYSLDELPQLWNVLKGDMSLVGPRPHPVEDCSKYTSEHFRRLGVTPGVTGLWQVLARANPSFEVCMTLDLAYIEKCSLLLDCKILLKTIPVVLAGEGQ